MGYNVFINRLINRRTNKLLITIIALEQKIKQIIVSEFYYWIYKLLCHNSRHSPIEFS